MALALDKRKQEYGFAKLTMTPKGFIASVTYPAKDVSNNGEHWGIIYNGNIYCNIHLTGLPKELWKNDFYGYYPIEYQELTIIE